MYIRDGSLLGKSETDAEDFCYCKVIAGGYDSSFGYYADIKISGGLEYRLRIVDPAVYDDMVAACLSESEIKVAGFSESDAGIHPIQIVI